MLFGMNPRFFRIASNCSFSAGEWSAGSGLIRDESIAR
jgi:hypothetical protein